MSYIIFGCALAGIFWWMVQRASERPRADLQKQIDRLSAALRNIHTNSTSAADEVDHDRNRTVGTSDSSEQTNQISLASASDGETCADHARIQAALSARLGRKVIVRSVREIENTEPMGSWTTQGWIAVQSSHSQFARRE